MRRWCAEGGTIATRGGALGEARADAANGLWRADQRRRCGEAHVETWRIAGAGRRGGCGGCVIGAWQGGCGEGRMG